MDILFENHYERTPEMTKEIYRFLCYKRPAHIVIYVIMGIVFLWDIVATILGRDFPLVLTVYFVLLLVIQFVLYARAVNTAISRDREQHGSESVKVCMEVTEQGVRCVYTEIAGKPVALSNIKKIFTTKKYIVLHTKANLMYVFCKDNFTIGTQEGFLKYLREQGLKV